MQTLSQFDVRNGIGFEGSAHPHHQVLEPMVGLIEADDRKALPVRARLEEVVIIGRADLLEQVIRRLGNLVRLVQSNVENA